MELNLETVKSLLPQYGYTPIDSDDVLINLAIEKVTNYVLIWCNITSIPHKLIPEMLDMVCGEFLYRKAGMNALSDGGLTFEKGVSSISEGDTSVSFHKNRNTDEEIFIEFLNELRKGRNEVLEQFRKLKW